MEQLKLTKECVVELLALGLYWQFGEPPPQQDLVKSQSRSFKWGTAGDILWRFVRLGVVSGEEVKRLSGHPEYVHHRRKVSDLCAQLHGNEVTKPELLFCTRVGTTNVTELGRLMRDKKIALIPRGAEVARAAEMKYGALGVRKKAFLTAHEEELVPA